MTSAATPATATPQQQQKQNEEVILQYKAMRAELQRMAQKVGDLEAEKEEHRLVLETMEPLPGDRACYRLINGVLVARTVAEVTPLLKQNATNLGFVIEKLLETYKKKEQELLAYQQKHQIRVEATAGGQS